MLMATSIILATCEAEIRRVEVPGHPMQIVHEALSPNNQSKMDWKCSSSGRTPDLQA
jgi:hypothetical protein